VRGFLQTDASHSVFLQEKGLPCEVFLKQMCFARVFLKERVTVRSFLQARAFRACFSSKKGFPCGVFLQQMAFRAGSSFKNNPAFDFYRQKIWVSFGFFFKGFPSPRKIMSRAGFPSYNGFLFGGFIKKMCFVRVFLRKRGSSCVFYFFEK